MIYTDEAIKDLFLKAVCQEIPCGSQRCDRSDEWLEGCKRYKDFRNKIKSIINEAKEMP